MKSRILCTLYANQGKSTVNILRHKGAGVITAWLRLLDEKMQAGKEQKQCLQTRPKLGAQIMSPSCDQSLSGW